MIIPFEQILEQMALLLVWIQNWLPISIMLIKVISWSYLLLLVGILEELHMPAAKFWQEKLKTRNKGLFHWKVARIDSKFFRLLPLFQFALLWNFCAETAESAETNFREITESLKFWNEESESRRNSHITRDLELSVSTY